MSNSKIGLSATDEVMRLASGAHRPFGLTSVTDNLIDKSMREARSLADLASGRVSDFSPFDKALHASGGVTDAISRIAEGGLADTVMRDALSGSGGTLAAAMGRSDTLADAVRGLKDFRGIDDNLLSNVKSSLGKFETASATLRDELAKGQSGDVSSFADRELRIPPMLPMPRNPILETNELPDEMVGRLADQHALIEASAEAQKRETELLGQLVEAFTRSQAESDRATRRAQMQAWIGIGVAVATGVAPLLILIFSGH